MYPNLSQKPHQLGKYSRNNDKKRINQNRLSKTMLNSQRMANKTVSMRNSIFKAFETENKSRTIHVKNHEWMHLTKTKNFLVIVISDHTQHVSYSQILIFFFSFLC